jgi:hypothetical protein
VPATVAARTDWNGDHRQQQESKSMNIDKAFLLWRVIELAVEVYALFRRL